MPTLLRFLIIVGGLAALVFGGMIYLANGVKVHPREITQSVELPKVAK